MPQLGSRERVLRSLAGEVIDRPPCFFRAEAPVRARLRQELGLETDLELARHFGADALHAAPAFRRERFRQDPDPDHFYDMFGNRYRRVAYAGLYSETVVQPVLRGADRPEAVEAYRWPDPDQVLDLEESFRRAGEARASGLAVYGGIWASVFTHSRAMLGEEDYLVALVACPELIERLVGRMTEFFLELNARLLEVIAPSLDIYYFGSDFGTQQSLFVSPEMFRRFYQPSLARLAAQARGYGLRVMYHTCGAVAPIIPDLIACGIEVLDPVQVSAAGMSPPELSAFRGKIAFHGGISTQTVLPVAGPDQVRQSVHQTIDRLGPSGLIVAPDQDLMDDIPTANIEALFHAVHDYRQ